MSFFILVMQVFESLARQDIFLSKLVLVNSLRVTMVDDQNDLFSSLPTGRRRRWLSPMLRAPVLLLLQLSVSVCEVFKLAGADLNRRTDLLFTGDGEAFNVSSA